MAEIGETVSLNFAEQSLCKLIAERRFANNREKGVKNSKRGNQSDEFTDLEGIASELAFCKLFNVYPDLTIHTRSATKNEDDGDLMVDGFVIDVKATKYKNGKLIAVPWKKASGDLFALMVGVFPSYEFRGLMLQKELLKDSRLKDLGHGSTYVAEQSELLGLQDATEEALTGVFF